MEGIPRAPLCELILQLILLPFFVLTLEWSSKYYLYDRIFKFYISRYLGGIRVCLAWKKLREAWSVVTCTTINLFCTLFSKLLLEKLAWKDRRGCRKFVSWSAARSVFWWFFCYNDTVLLFHRRPLIYSHHEYAIVLHLGTSLYTPPQHVLLALLHYLLL